MPQPENTTIGQLQAQFSLRLQGIYPAPEADSITQLVFGEVLELEPLQLRLKRGGVMDAKAAQTLDSILHRLLKNEPVQYVLGAAWFYGLKFLVDENTLIPRRETEELVELIGKQNTLPAPRVLDIGTGSGCIAITLQKNMPSSQVYGVDVSERALRVAQQNAELIVGNGKRDDFFVRDIFDQSWWGEFSPLDIIVSNPPYVTEAEKQQMHPNVLHYEPDGALFVPDVQPLIYYETIAGFALQNLTPGGRLYFEINEQFGNEICQMLLDKGFSQAVIHKDMQGKDRMVVGVL